MNFLDFTDARKLDNLFTGGRLTAGGKTTVGALGAASLGYSALSKGITPDVSKVAPGIRQAPQMSFDMKRTPNFGASGSLTLALSKFDSR